MPHALRPLRLGLLLAAGGLLVAHALVFDFVNDDAFISFRYADNLVRHGVLEYNPGERVEGYTNFLWTLIIALVLALKGEPVFWSKVISVGLGLGSLAVIARFSARSEARGASAWDALGPLLLAAAPAYACWSTGGLETQLFTFTVTLGWTAYLEEQAPGARGWPRSGVYFALSALARPEGMLFFGLTGLHRLITLLFVERRWRPPARDWLWGLGFALVFGPYFLWRLRYYGHPFPNTYYVKTGAQDFWGPGARYLWSWVRDHGLFLLLPLALVFRRALPAGRGGRLWALVGLYTVALSLHVARVGGDFMGLHRFFVPLMPALALLIAQGLRTLAEGLRARGPAWARGGLVVAALATAGAAWQVHRVDSLALTVGSDRGVDRIGWLKQFAQQCAAIGQWIALHTPEDARLATTAAGTLPFYARRYTYDILLLNVDTEVVKQTPARGNRPGHTKSASMAQILAQDIDWLVFHPTISASRPGPRGGPPGYEWFTVQVPGLEPPWWGVHRRR